MDGVAQRLRSSASSSSSQQHAPASPSAKAPYQMQFAEHDDDMLAKVPPFSRPTPLRVWAE